MALSTQATSSIRAAVSILTPHSDEDGRVAGLISKMRQITDSADSEQAADRLANIGESEDVRKAQAAYLREVSPSAADAWEQGRIA